MKYALGCAFSIDDLIMNLPYKRLKLTCKDCYKIMKDNHRNILAKKIFRESYKLVINDIIENNITFKFPLNGIRECSMHMRKVQGVDFLNLRRHGKWKDVDIVASMFTGYEIGLFMYGKRTPRVKTVYVSKDLKNKITLYTNLGKQYGDGKVDKTINDYLEQICNLFPLVPECDIKRILVFTWKSLYLHNSYGGDVRIVDNFFWSYIGHLTNDPLKHFRYYIKKLIIKLRVIYKRKKIPWDGYYYFALTINLYKRYISLKKRRGRPRKHFKFQQVFLYKILDECKIKEFDRRYIFRIPYITAIASKIYTQELVTDKAELIITRNPLKFKDISVYEHKYDFL